MKKILVAIAVLAAGVASASAQGVGEASTNATVTSSLASARSQIDKAIASPETMTELMKGLSAADQKQFLADVNKAISDMPASIEEKTAKFLNVDSAALKGAAPGNLSTLVAEVFATVPTESLTVLSERFASDLFSRTADPRVTYTDEQYTRIAVDLMNKVNERCEETDNGSPRAAFAILMLVRASGGSPADLADKLVETLKHDDARELAKTEWLPSALGLDGRESSYESILASADAGRRPDLDMTIVIAGPQFPDMLLSDLIGKNVDLRAAIDAHAPLFDASKSALLRAFPTLGAGLPGDMTDNPATHPLGGDVPHSPTPIPIPTPTPTPTPTPVPPEPGPYQWQVTR